LQQRRFCHTSMQRNKNVLISLSQNQPTFVYFLQICTHVVLTNAQ